MTTQPSGQVGSSSGPARYELTVTGRIGPVVRRALRLHGGDAARVCLTMRADGPDDLADLVRAFDAHGVEIDNVTRLPTTASDG